MFNFWGSVICTVFLMIAAFFLGATFGLGEGIALAESEFKAADCTWEESVE